MALRREAIITRIRSMTGVRLIPANLSSFQREICGDNSEFGSHMASQAVQLRKSVLETRIELPPKELDQIHDRPLRAHHATVAKPQRRCSSRETECMVSAMTDDERAIRELVNVWLAASKAGDLQTILSLMTNDVIFMVPGRRPFGKEAFAAASQEMQNVSMEGISDIQEIQVLGDWAYLRNYIEMVVTPPNGAPVRRSGYTLTILRKGSDGRWRLARDANLLTEAK